MSYDSESECHTSPATQIWAIVISFLNYLLWPASALYLLFLDSDTEAKNVHLNKWLLWTELLLILIYGAGCPDSTSQSPRPALAHIVEFVSPSPYWPQPSPPHHTAQNSSCADSHSPGVCLSSFACPGLKECLHPTDLSPVPACPTANLLPGSSFPVLLRPLISSWVPAYHLALSNCSPSDSR